MQYDIAIIGGGMVGAAFACALQDTQLKIALVDATPHSNQDDPRLIALTHSSCCFFENIGVWSLLVAHAEPIKHLHVSHQGRFGITRIQAQELNLTALGHLVPAKYINAALEEKLKHLKNVDVIRPATLKNITPSSEKISTVLQLQTTNGIIEIETKLLIGADGTHSTVRELLNIPTKTIDYAQSAIVTITDLQREHENTAYERFTAQGAIAMLPLKGNRCATIWTEDNSAITTLLQKSDAEFLTVLQKEFGYRLGRFQKTHQRFTFPLKLTIAECSPQKNVVLIGNAAHTIHPIAAQGLNIALYEIAELIELIKENPATIPSLNEKTNRWNIQLSHKLSWLFSTDLFMLNIARQLGMISLDNCTTAKKFFMRKAMGQTGNTPHLLRKKDYYASEVTGH